jgi:hypothetical protein
MGLLGTLVALRLLIWLVYRGGSGLMLSRAAAITNGRYYVIALFDMCAGSSGVATATPRHPLERSRRSH